MARFPALGLTVEVTTGCTSSQNDLDAVIRVVVFQRNGQVPVAGHHLAVELGVSQMTVNKSILEMVGQGWLYREHGRGTFVADRAPANAELGRLAARAANDARRAGIEPRALAAAMYVGSDGQPGSYRDFDTADTLFHVGQNVAETKTVLWSRILDRRRGPQV